jgi:hypothetical protein
MGRRLKFGKAEWDENLSFKTQDIHTNGVTISTPIKAIDRTKFAGIKLKDNIKGLNEIYKIIYEKNTPKKTWIETLSSDPDELYRYNNSINRSLSNNDPKKELSICFVAYNGDNYPTGKKLALLADISYSFSDFTPIPIVLKMSEKLKKQNGFNEYMAFLNEAYEVVDTLNHKPIMGIIPNVAQKDVDVLTKFYIDNDVNSFCFDFNGKKPISMQPNIRMFLRTIKEYNLLDEFFVHSMNVLYGRGNKKKNVVPASNIFSFGFGFNSLGEDHTLRGNKEFFNKIKMSSKESSENWMRLFIKENYGYYNIKFIDEIKDKYPLDSNIPINLFNNVSSQIKTYQKAFNIEQLGLECLNLKKIIKENNTLNYLNKKAEVNKNELITIKNIKNEIFSKQASLSDWL